MPKVILNTINEVLMVQGLSNDIILNATYAFGHAEFHVLINLLDFACYYKDKQKEHSDIVCYHDAPHAYYAQLCDYLVTQDSRMRMKAKAIYTYKGIIIVVL